MEVLKMANHLFLGKVLTVTNTPINKIIRLITSTCFKPKNIKYAQSGRIWGSINPNRYTKPPATIIIIPNNITFGTPKIISVWFLKQFGSFNNLCFTYLNQFDLGCWELMKENPQLYNSQHPFNIAFVILYIELTDKRMGYEMAIIISDVERDELIKSIKKPVSKVSSIIMKKKSSMKYREFEMALFDSENRQYKMIIRRNIIDQFDFSILLRYFHKDAKLWRTLVRYNGCHIHVNKLEKKKIECFHVHKITEKYQKADFREEGFAELTQSYCSYDTAINQFIKNNNVKNIPFIPQLTNWEEWQDGKK